MQKLFKKTCSAQFFKLAFRCRFRGGLPAGLAWLPRVCPLSDWQGQQRVRRLECGIFPLSKVHRGLHGTAWTVFEGTVPEPMDVEILGVLHGARGPHRDLILARLHGTKPEYTGVVAGMSGSPVYIDGKLAGALSYRIGQFSKEPIAGITPIEQMLEVRDLPVRLTRQSPIQIADKDAAATAENGALTFSAMETPLMMSGFQPEAIRLWKRADGGDGAGCDFGGRMAAVPKRSRRRLVRSAGSNPAHPVGKAATILGRLCRVRR